MNRKGRNKKRKYTPFISKMVPEEKAKLTEMLHEYIKVHKLKSASTTVRQDGSHSAKQAMTLVMGESDQIKA